MLFCPLLIFFNIDSFFFKNKYYRNDIRLSNSLDPDQARHFYPGPNCLQRLSADANGKERGHNYYHIM